jgi:hypothetical protein
VAAADGAAAKLGGADWGLAARMRRSGAGRGEPRRAVRDGSWTGLDWELGLLRGWGVLGGFRCEGKKKARHYATPKKNKMFRLALGLEIIADTSGVAKQHIPTLYLSTYICRHFICWSEKRRHLIRRPFVQTPTLYSIAKVTCLLIINGTRINMLFQHLRVGKGCTWCSEL